MEFVRGHSVTFNTTTSNAHLIAVLRQVHVWLQHKKHDVWFKKSLIGVECRFPLISFFNLNIVVPQMDVKFSEISGPSEFIDEFRNKRKRISIFYSDLV